MGIFKKARSIATIILVLGCFFGIQIGSASAVADECPKTPNGIQRHTWESTEPTLILSFSSGPCNEFGNPGSGRICTACGKRQDFLVYDNWVYTLRDDGTAEIVRCDIPEEETNSVMIPETLNGIPVTAIGDNAFSGCYYLIDVTIPDGITSIGDFAFAECTNLKSVIIPDSVVSIGCNPFLRMGIEIQLSDDQKVFELVDGSLYDRQDKRLIYSFVTESNNANYYIPEGTLEIGDYAFYGSDLFWVTLPRSICKIGNYAFNECRKLIMLETQEGITDIGDFAFCSCESLYRIHIPDSVTSVGNNPFISTPVHLSISPDHPYFAMQDNVLFEKESRKLISFPYGSDSISYTIPQGIREIGDRAFSYTKLSQLEIPDSVVDIGEGAFYCCMYLTQIKIPEGITSIRENTFSRCYSMDSVIVPESITEIGKGAFYDCQSLNSISIPTGVRSLGEGAFQMCISLSQMDIPGSIGKIPQSAFDGCVLLEKVTIQSGVTQIEPYAFYHCNVLSQIGLPDTLTTIGEKAFFRCSALEQIAIPEGVIFIGEGAFDMIPNLTVISLPQQRSLEVPNYCWDHVSNYSIINEESSNCVTVSIVAPDYTKFILDIILEYGESKINPKALSDAIKKGPSQQNEYIVTSGGSDEESIKQSFIDRIAKELIVESIIRSDYTEDWGGK